MKRRVSWKVYYTVTNAQCDPEECKAGITVLPATTFSYLTYSYKYVGGIPRRPCAAPTAASTVVGDTYEFFLHRSAPHRAIYDATYGYFADLKNGTLPSFVFIESGSGMNDEHPGYQQSILAGQTRWRRSSTR